MSRKAYGDADDAADDDFDSDCDDDDDVDVDDNENDDLDGGVFDAGDAMVMVMMPLFLIIRMRF